MLVNIPSSKKVKSLRGAKLDNIKEFKYLCHCSTLSMTLSAGKHKPGLKATSLRKYGWKSNLDMPIKIKFFRACAESILLYDSETWTVTKTLKMLHTVAEESTIISWYHQLERPQN